MKSAIDSLPARTLGNKRKLLPHLLRYVKGLRRILDGFAGSGIVSLALKHAGHEVISVESRPEAWAKVYAVVENSSEILTPEECRSLSEAKPLKGEVLSVFGENSSFLASACGGISRISDLRRRTVAAATLLIAIERRRIHWVERKHRYAEPGIKDEWMKLVAETFPHWLHKGDGCKAILGDIVEEAKILGRSGVDAAILDWPYAGRAGYDNNYRISEQIAALCGLPKSPSPCHDFCRPSRAIVSIIKLLQALEHVPLWVVCSNNDAFFPPERFRLFAAMFGRSAEIERFKLNACGNLKRADEFIITCRPSKAAAAWRNEAIEKLAGRMAA